MSRAQRREIFLSFQLFLAALDNPKEVFKKQMVLSTDQRPYFVISTARERSRLYMTKRVVSIFFASINVVTENKYPGRTLFV
jgi:hypothetical protein